MCLFRYTCSLSKRCLLIDTIETIRRPLELSVVLVKWLLRINTNPKYYFFASLEFVFIFWMRNRFRKLRYISIERSIDFGLWKSTWTWLSPQYIWEQRANTKSILISVTESYFYGISITNIEMFARFFALIMQTINQKKIKRLISCHSIR